MPRYVFYSSTKKKYPDPRAYFFGSGEVSAWYDNSAVF